MPNSAAAQAKLAKASELVDDINKEVYRAIALAAMWGRARSEKDVLDAANNAELKAFHIVRDALHKDLILTLIKLYDRREDDLAFPRLFRIVADPEVHPLLARAKACDKANKKHLKAKNCSPYKSLRLLRDKILAHTNTGDIDQTAVYGHEVQLLKYTISIATLLSTGLGARSPHSVGAKRVWDYESDRFWTAVINGAKDLPSPLTS